MDFYVEQGTLLASGPDMLDPNFMHTVVLMCQHGESGAFGLVLNRPSTQTTQSVLSDELALGRVDVPIFVGGPVGHDRLQVLHRVPEIVEGGVELARGVWIGGDLECLGGYAESDPEGFASNVRLVLGYAGWSEEQLEGELEEGAWLPAQCSSGLVFDEDPGGLWRHVVRSIGDLSDGLDLEPPDPSWN